MADNTTKLIINGDASGAVAALDKLHAGLKKSQSETTNALSAIKSGWIGVASALAIPLSIGGIGAMIKSTTEAAEKMELLMQKTGASYETLKVLSYTAKLAGTDIDGVAKAMGILAKNMQGAAIDMDGSGKSFKALGIETKNAQGGLKSIDTILPELADRFKGMSDGTGKTAYAMAIFGKSGKDMIPILNEGAGGLKEMKEEMEALGFTFNEGGNKQAAALNENIERLELTMGNLKSRVIKELVPGLLKMSDIFIENIKSGGALEGTIGGLGTALTWVMKAGVGTAAAFDIVGTAIGGMAVRAVQIGQVAMNAWKMSLGIDVVNQFKELRTNWKAFTSDIGLESDLEKKMMTYGAMIEAIGSKDYAGKIDLKKKPGTDDPPLLGTKDTAKDTVSSINALADATARWQAKVADLNPYLDTQDKKMIDIQSEAEKLIMSGANLETVYDGLSEGRAFLQMAKDAKYASQAIEETNKYATEQQKIQLELQKIITDTAIASARSRADMQTSLIDLQVDKGAISIAEGISARYQIEKNLLDVEAQRLRIYNDMGEGVTDETALNILRDTTDLENRRNSLANQHTIELEKNRRAIILQSSSVSGGLMVAYEDLYRSRITWSQAAYNFEMDTYRAMGDGFGDLFYDAITGDLKNMSDYWDSMWKSMAKSMSQQLGQMAAQWSSQQIGNIFGMNTGSSGGGMNYNGGSGGGFNWGSLLSGAGSGIWDWVTGSDTGSNWGSLSDSVGTAWDWVTDLFHTGGVVGQTNVPTRTVNSSIFANAPRLHDGLAADEFPAILQAGETVIPRGGSNATDDFLKTAKQFRGIVLDGGYSYADMMGTATSDFVGSVSTATSSFSSNVSTAGTGFAHSAMSAIGSVGLGMVGGMVGGPIGGLAGKAIGGWIGGWLGDKISGWFGDGYSGGKYGTGKSDYWDQLADDYATSQGPYEGAPNAGNAGGPPGTPGSPDSNAPDYDGSGYHYGGVPMYDRARNMLPGERLAKITNTEGVFTQGQMKAIGEKLNERSQGPSIGEIHLHIGNEEFNGAMKVIADGVVVERNKRGVIPTSRVYNA